MGELTCPPRRRAISIIPTIPHCFLSIWHSFTPSLSAFVQCSLSRLTSQRQFGLGQQNDHRTVQAGWQVGRQADRHHTARTCARHNSLAPPSCPGSIFFHGSFVFSVLPQRSLRHKSVIVVRDSNLNVLTLQGYLEH
ncbi:hypothetical protein E2C01_018681 [Portunus trituberculatus]|uniref:Uncharacterized protein n=1 Tax=Portunus trituberculatus TaxID=210409 RepID=A0A5B7DV65_PORTR|nr:hypothetical protein [Portunus trituberculatus]